MAAERRDVALKKNVVDKFDTIHMFAQSAAMAQKYDPNRWNISGIKCKICGGHHKSITHVRDPEQFLPESKKTQLMPRKPKKEIPKDIVLDPVTGHKELFNMDSRQTKKLHQKHLNPQKQLNFSRKEQLVTQQKKST